VSGARIPPTPVKLAVTRAGPGAKRLPAVLLASTRPEVPPQHPLRSGRRTSRNFTALSRIGLAAGVAAPAPIVRVTPPES